MNFREALITDIPHMMAVQQTVKEKTSSNPDLATDRDYEAHLSESGKGWVCEIDNKIVGFAITDLSKNNVWALYVLPEFEGQGVGRELLILLLDWYYSKTTDTIWLSAAPKTRAADFCRSFGWKEAGVLPNGDMKFELTADDWGV